jgi:hypothetical protein
LPGGLFAPDLADINIQFFYQDVVNLLVEFLILVQERGLDYVVE